MLCPTCHVDVPADAAFCPKCGQRLSATAPGTAGAPVAGTPAAATPALTATEKFRAAMPGQPAAEPEHDLWHGTYSAKAMYGGWVFAIVVTLAGVALAVLVPNPAAWIAAVVVVPVIWISQLLTLLYRRMSVEYRLTTQRFLHKRGLLRRVADQLLLVDVDDVTWEQGLVERIVNVGKITIHSNDASDPKLPLPGIDDVERVANLIDNARREERRKRAIYMASA